MSDGNDPLDKSQDVVLDQKDDRIVVSDTTVKPYTGICALHAFAPSSSRTVKKGTGWLINPQIVATAAHVVYDPADPAGGGFGSKRNGYAGLVSIFPALNSVTGNEDRFDSIDIHVCPVYEQSQSVDFDIAVLRLSEPVPSHYSSLNFAVVSDRDILNAVGTIAGYPVNKLDGKLMVEATGKIVEAESQRVLHEIDTAVGLGGAPLWILENNGSISVVAQQARGISNKPVSTATRISRISAKWLNSHIDIFG